MLLDVDTGVDDALALAFAVRHPRIELMAVTTVAGNVDVELTTRNTLRVLDWLGATDVPVARGAERPLVGVSRDAAYWHGDDGLGGAQLPEARRDALPDGVDYLIDCVLRQPGELTLVCTGPLTNLALAAQRQPAIVGAVKDVVVMGGAVRVPGNVTPVAEFNIHADPEAAAVVFGLPWPATLVGLDVTSRVLLTTSDRAALEHLRGPEATLVWLATHHAFDTNRLEAISLHDPLAVAVAVQPDLVTTIERLVLVETRGEHTLGQTVVDLRPRVPEPSSTRVCLDVDALRAKALFENVLGLQDGASLRPG
jgi:purine nucleosidase